MISGKRWLCRALVVSSVPESLVVAQDKSTISTDGSQVQDIASLRAMIAAQQKQLDALKQALDNQQKVLDQTAATAKRRLRRMLARWPVSRLFFRPPHRQLWQPFRLYRFRRQHPRRLREAIPAKLRLTSKVPAYIRIGDTCVVPIGFMDMTECLAQQGRRLQHRDQRSPTFLITTSLAGRSQRIPF